MKRFLFLLVVIFGIGTVGLISQTQKKSAQPKKKIYPATAVREAVKNIKVGDVKEVVIVIPSQTMVISKQNEIRPLLNGLKSAVWPCNPDMLPGNRTLSIKLILKSGQIIGPFGFSNETPNDAFGMGFAEAYNRLNPRIKVNMPKGPP